MKDFKYKINGNDYAAHVEQQEDGTANRERRRHDEAIAQRGDGADVREAPHELHELVKEFLFCHCLLIPQIRNEQISKYLACVKIPLSKVLDVRIEHVRRALTELLSTTAS